MTATPPPTSFSPALQKTLAFAFGPGVQPPFAFLLHLIATCAPVFVSIFVSAGPVAPV
jgi:hypothetical protein